MMKTTEESILPDTKKKRLILFRHAKSDWRCDVRGDLERPLNQRGCQTACIMGRLLARSGQIPDHILTSPAQRARQTIEYAIECGQWNRHPVVCDALYDAGARDVLSCLRQCSDRARTVLMTGHEPTFSQLIRILVGPIQLRYPTGALTRIDLDITQWCRCQAGCGELIWHLQPKFFTKGHFDLSN